MSETTAKCATILLTGATGYIGQAFARHAARNGQRVIGLSRSASVTGDLCSHHAWQLGDDLPAGLPVPTAALHLAHDFSGEAGAARTIHGTTRLVEQLLRLGVERQVFVSSCSAGPHAASLYGRTKTEIETRLKPLPGLCIARPGLVLGDGGIFGRIVAMARRLPIVPLPDGGKGRVPVIPIDRLCRELLGLCTGPVPPQDINLFLPAMPTLRQLVEAALAASGQRKGFLPVPVAAVLPVMRMLERLGIHLPVSSDSLLGFSRNQSASHVAGIADE
ncbi:MAG: NAD(P)-dependent oxidoreductase [Rhizobiales bacterium]|nr:NAD(P)-dependent oxidoreductase [Hyphomicrobiales bacterium]